RLSTTAHRCPVLLGFDSPRRRSPEQGGSGARTRRSAVSDSTIVIVGGTSGIGLEIARDTIARGDRVVITGRDQARADEIAGSLGPAASGVALDISEPSTIAGQLSSIGPVHGLVLAAIERDQNTI